MRTGRAEEIAAVTPIPALFVSIAGLTMALSGFLLFQVQPMLARYILPWFGGSATTWTVCLLFFQLSLLLGYAYAHLVARLLGPRARVAIHLVIVAVSLATLPITPSEGFRPPDADHPTWRILVLLTACVGLPYFLLSTTTPLVQNWLAFAGSGTPSRLFALSNLGSFLGLLSYPLVVDLYFPTDAQTWGWSAGYVVYAVLISAFGLLVAFVARNGPEAAAPESITVTDAAARSAPGSFPLWFALSTFGSISLLAITNYITSYVSVNPFLWILPLSLYLLSFVVAFARPSLYRPGVFGLLYAAALAFNFFTATNLGIDNAFGVIVVNLVCFALCCMVCQGELARRQPAPERLTAFYLTLAAGGAAGGVFVSLIAPLVFPDYWELPLGLIGVGIIHIVLNRPQGEVRSLAPQRFAMPAAVVLAAGFALYTELFEGDELVDRHRNFYGVLKVEEIDAGDPKWHRHIMVQAGENQGEQLLDPAKRNRATCDFGPASGIGRALASLQRRQPDGVRLGIVGLGAGMLVSQGRPMDSFRYYELNPTVTDFARQHFTFLADAQSPVDVIHGDGRLALERELKAEGSREFDLLHIDAFRGNAPPAHLMTKEAFDVYFQHLRKGGVLAVTSHNDYYDASSLFRGMAELAGAQVRWLPPARGADCERSVGFALFSRDPAFFADAGINAVGWEDKSDSKTVWTDQRSSLMSLMVWAR